PKVGGHEGLSSCRWTALAAASSQTPFDGDHQMRAMRSAFRATAIPVLALGLGMLLGGVQAGAQVLPGGGNCSMGPGATCFFDAQGRTGCWLFAGTSDSCNNVPNSERDCALCTG